MAQLRIDFQGRGEVETLSRTRVQAMGDGVQLALRIARQVRPLGQVLPQQPIRVLVGPPLPGAMRIGNEHPDRKPLCQALMLGHFFPPIIGQGFPQRSGHMPEFLHETLVRTLGIRSVHAGQQDQAGRPLQQGADGRPIASSLQEVAFPVARHRAGGDLSRALGNRRHVGELAPSVGPPRSRPARLVCLPQRGQPFAPQRAAWQHIQARIDGLCRELFPHVVRIRACETPGNLLRRAALGQVGTHILPQPGIQEFTGAPGLTGSGGRQRLGCTGAIRMAPCPVAGVSRLKVLGARLKTAAIVRNEYPWAWARPRLTVSRSSALMCL